MGKYNCLFFSTAINIYIWEEEREGGGGVGFVLKFLKLDIT